jgi:UDP-4-amino-4,6-dideoxy-N-acetyl-beta-L-altrosamine N-acetyltransferase
MEVYLKLITENELEMMMEWRMRPNITRYMNTDPVLTIEGQRAWLTAIRKDCTRRDWIVYLKGVPAGYVNLVDIDSSNSRCGWGWFLACEEGRSLQLATFLEWNLYDYAFNHLKLHKLCNETFVENKFVVQLHRLCGSREEGILRQHICKNGKYYDLSVGSILAEEWEEKRKSLRYESFSIEDDRVKDQEKGREKDQKLDPAKDQEAEQTKEQELDRAKD